MLSRQRLSFAIEVHSKSFQLLRWLENAVEKQLIPIARAQKHSDTPQAAVEWISDDYWLFPIELQPRPEQLREFANFFWTYLVSSFDVVAHPGTRLTPGVCGCLCPLCARIENAPHLQPKKLTQCDKSRARELMIDRVAALAAEEQLSVEYDRCCHIVDDAHTRRSAGFSAYGSWLIKRLSGETDGPSILALWREIAWRKEGSPIAGFKPAYEAFESAEKLLISELREHRS